MKIILSPPRVNSKHKNGLPGKLKYRNISLPNQRDSCFVNCTTILISLCMHALMHQDTQKKGDVAWKILFLHAENVVFNSLDENEGLKISSSRGNVFERCLRGFQLVLVRSIWRIFEKHSWGNRINLVKHQHGKICSFVSLESSILLPCSSYTFIVSHDERIVSFCSKYRRVTIIWNCLIWNIFIFRVSFWLIVFQPLTGKYFIKDLN